MTDIELKMFAALRQAGMAIEHLARVTKVQVSNAIGFISGLSLVGVLLQTSVRAALHETPQAIVAGKMPTRPR